MRYARRQVFRQTIKGRVALKVLTPDDGAQQLSKMYAQAIDFGIPPFDADPTEILVECLQDGVRAMVPERGSASGKKDLCLWYLSRLLLLYKVPKALEVSHFAKVLSQVTKGF